MKYSDYKKQEREEAEAFYFSNNWARPISNQNLVKPSKLNVPINEVEKINFDPKGVLKPPRVVDSDQLASRLMEEVSFKKNCKYNKSVLSMHTQVLVDNLDFNIAKDNKADKCSDYGLLNDKVENKAAYENRYGVKFCESIYSNLIEASKCSSIFGLGCKSTHEYHSLLMDLRMIPKGTFERDKVLLATSKIQSHNSQRGSKKGLKKSLPRGPLDRAVFSLSLLQMESL